MLKNIFLELEYEGTSYHGWQIQNTDKKLNTKGQKKTIQGELEKALKRLFLHDIRPVYSGRTDKGVHAKGQCVNFIVDTHIPLKCVKQALNGFLSGEIKIRKIRKVPLSFHSRFSACSKIYRYIIRNITRSSVFERNYSWHISERLDISAMEKISGEIIGYRDFSLFARESGKYPDCRRHVKKILLKRRAGYIYIDIEADGFLRCMARKIVAFLIKVGKNEISCAQGREILKGKKRYVNRPAPPEGLYLYKVLYA